MLSKTLVKISTTIVLALFPTAGIATSHASEPVAAGVNSSITQAQATATLTPLSASSVDTTTTAKKAAKKKAAAKKAAKKAAAKKAAKKAAAKKAAAKKKTKSPGLSTKALQRDKIVVKAKSLAGTPYRSGGKTPKGFDCSGFTSYVYGKAGIKIPSNSGGQKAAGKRIPRSKARPGDLIWTPGHVSIYLGGNKQIDAPKPGKRIQVRSIWQSNPTFLRF